MDAKHYKTYIQIGLNILHYRRERGYTQEQLAEMTGYSRQQIQRVETAYSKPSVAILLDIAAALEIPVEKLFEMR
ncbi:MAG: helix-turn-helix transcriptional regulator [Oscillibacter sp.]|nr:helix-turn-helix transcriptional regulator [Oscillibacter sp.]